MTKFERVFLFVTLNDKKKKNKKSRKNVYKIKKIYSRKLQGFFSILHRAGVLVIAMERIRKTNKKGNH